MARFSKHKNGYAGIRKLATEDGDLPLRRVDLSNFAPKGLKAQISAFATRIFVPLAMRYFRHFPVFRFADLYWITRDEEVRAVLADHEAFEVPFGLEMRHLTGSATFCLGDDSDLHRRQRSALEEAWEGMDDEADVRAPARKFARALLADSGGEVEVVGDLIRQVVARVSERLLGCEISDYTAHSEAVIATASFLFGDPYGKPHAREEGLVAARNLKPTIDLMVRSSIHGPTPPENGFIGIIPGMARALKRHLESGQDPNYDETALKGDLEATGYGMTTAFAVTHGFTGGILQTLGRRPEQFDRTRELASRIKSARESKDEEAAAAHLRDFERLMMEASRFSPAIFPGSFRVRTGKKMQAADKHPKLEDIPKDKTLIVCTASAVRDRRCQRDECREPQKFDPGRFDPDELHKALGFGYGIHACIGARQAISIAGEVLIELLTQRNLRFVQGRPRVKMHGPVHVSLPMRFDPEEGALKQSQIIAPIPLRPGVERMKAMERLKRIEEEADLKRAFDRSNVVHFASLHILELGKIGKERDHLLVELNVDGTKADALTRIGEAIEGDKAALAAVGRLADLILFDDTVRDGALWAFLRQVEEKAAELTDLPFGDTGGNFVGTGEFSVKQIEEEARLASLVEEYLTDKGQLAAAKDSSLAEAAWSTRLFLLTLREVQNSKLGHLLIRLKKRGPQFARSPYLSFKAFPKRYLSQMPILLTVGLYAAISIGTLLHAMFAEGSSFALYLVVTLTPPLVLLSLFAGLFLWLLRREKREKPDDSIVDLDRLRAIRAAEERTDHAQTHITSLSPFKTGLFRRLTFALAMHIITSFVRLWFRPGFLTDFATIHYARWVRFSGTDQLVFQSNYDGSWESYLEDFITKVHKGQTLAWNNARGFPKTRLLWLDGARDGDRFKRWVRNQQQVTPFWYSRFPDLTIPQIHRNALIRDGLARARDVSDHRDWLKLFGSLPQKGTELEIDQVQALVFSGHGNHRAARCLPIRFDDPEKACQWLKEQLKKARDTRSASDFTKGKTSGNIATRPGPTPPTLAFGDGEPLESSLFIGLSARGLAKLGLPREPQCGLNAFPAPFLDGMRGRGAALDDPDHVYWSDAGWYEQEGETGPQPTRSTYSSDFEADAILLVYMKPAPKPPERGSGDGGSELNRFDQAEADLRAALGSLQMSLQEHGITFIEQPIDLSRPPGELASLGGFGFHEGASQPVIRGSRQASRRHVLEQDIMEPGEFLLGYEDARGFVPPAIVLRSDQAAEGTLPFAVPAREEPFPYFGNPEAGHLFDLGRNGSYLAIRQLEHLRDENDEEQFEIFASETAKVMAENIKGGRPLEDEYDIQTLTASSVDGLEGLTDLTEPPTPQVASFSAEHAFLKDLVRAKLLGRWRDGSSLVKHPLLSATSLLRQRFYRELADGPLEDLVRQANERAFQSVARGTGEEDGNAADYDRLIWDDAVWDAFIYKLQMDLQSAPEALRRPAQSALKSRWLRPSAEWPRMVDNDFMFGRDDPQGLACPIGSHVRRSNPRDTPNPNNKDQLAINNRHRLLRRGRPYRRSDKQTGGTFFACLNADIERQFEFVQRTWMNAGNFQGLVRQPDPVAAPHKKGDRFIIPHRANLNSLPYDRADGGKGAQDFTRLVGGGYFFLPSKAAMRYLVRRGELEGWSV